MTTYNKASLKTFFEQGDVPTGTNYADFIDSCVNLVETTAQAMAGPLSCTELITPRVSGTNVNFGGNIFNVAANSTISLGAGSTISVSAGTSINVSANDINVYSDNGIFLRHGESSSVIGMATNITLDCSNSISVSAANSVNIDAGQTINLNATTVVSALRVTTNISANTGTVYASALRAPSGIFGNSTPPIVSAAGTTQGAATLLSVSPVVRGQGTADGTTTGYAVPANKAGMIQYFIHEGTVSGNLWPPTGGTINALAANAAFALAANTMYTVIHKSASAYAVK